MGESVGWLAGTIAFGVVLGILTAGSWTAASGAMKVLKGFARILDWTGEALGVAFKALSRVGGFLLEAIQGLGRLVGNMGGAVRGILDALQEIGEKLIRFGEELLGLAGRRGAGEAAEEIAEETAEQAGKHGDNLTPPTRPGVEAPTTRAPISDPSLSPEHQQLLSSSASKRGDQLTPDELNAELEVAGRSPRQAIDEGEYVEEIDLPNGHEWKHNQDGTWCRFSDDPKCFPPGTVDRILDQTSKDVIDPAFSGSKSPALSRAAHGGGGALTQPRTNLVFEGGTKEFQRLLYSGESVEEGVEAAVKAVEDLWKADGQDMHPVVRERIKAYYTMLRESGSGIPFNKGTPGTHAEIRSFSDALFAGDPDPLLAVRRLYVPKGQAGKVGDPFQRCYHCARITEGIESATDK